jgi:hypothetical protein
VAILAAMEALWAQYRFTVIEHASALLGSATALWGHNAKWLEAVTCPQTWSVFSLRKTPHFVRNDIVDFDVN